MKNFKNFLKILNPQPKIGALEISDVDLKFSLIKDDEFISYSAKLAAGVIKDGKISDRERFLSALSVMHSQITAKMKERLMSLLISPTITFIFRYLICRCWKAILRSR